MRCITVLNFLYQEIMNYVDNYMAYSQMTKYFTLQINNKKSYCHIIVTEPFFIPSDGLFKPSEGIFSTIQTLSFPAVCWSDRRIHD